METTIQLSELTTFREIAESGGVTIYLCPYLVSSLFSENELAVQRTSPSDAPVECDHAELY